MKRPLIGVTTSTKAADLEKEASLQFYLDAVKMQVETLWSSPVIHPWRKWMNLSPA